MDSQRVRVSHSSHFRLRIPQERVCLSTYKCMCISSLIEGNITCLWVIGEINALCWQWVHDCHLCSIIFDSSLILPLPWSKTLLPYQFNLLAIYITGRYNIYWAFHIQTLLPSNPSFDSRTVLAFNRASDNPSFNPLPP